MNKFSSPRKRKQTPSPKGRGVRRRGKSKDQEETNTSTTVSREQDTAPPVQSRTNLIPVEPQPGPDSSIPPNSPVTIVEEGKNGGPDREEDEEEESMDYIPDSQEQERPPLMDPGQSANTSLPSTNESAKGRRNEKDPLEAANIKAIVARTKVLDLLGDNLALMKETLKKMETSADQANLVKTIHHFSMHLSAVSLWITTKDFVLPQDYDAYAAFCKAQDDYPPNELREVPEEVSPIDATAEKIFALFQARLNQEIAKIPIEGLIKMNKSFTRAQRQERNESLSSGEQVNAVELSSPTPSQEEGRSNTSGPREPSQSSTGQETLSPEPLVASYIPLKATKIWICSPNRDALRTLISYTGLNKFAKEEGGTIEVSNDHRWIMPFDSQEVAKAAMVKLEKKMPDLQKKRNISPYLGTPSLGGKELFTIRLADVNGSLFTKWWLTSTLNEENFKKDFLELVLKKNEGLFAAHDVFTIKHWWTASKYGTEAGKSMIGISIKVGPMSFDRCKPLMGRKEAGIHIWPTKEEFDKRRDKLERENLLPEEFKRNKSASRDKQQGGQTRPRKEQEESPPRFTLRLWGSFIPRICERCFSLDHEEKDCEVNRHNAIPPFPCSICKKRGLKGEDLNHNTNSFKCPWYRGLSNLMEERSRSFRGGH